MGSGNGLQTRLELAARFNFVGGQEANELVDEVRPNYKMIPGFYKEPVD